MAVIFEKRNETGYCEQLTIESDGEGLIISMEEYTVVLDLTESEELVGNLSQWIRDRDGL